MRSVLVTDAGRGSGTAIIRSLGAAGWKVVGSDSDRFAPGRFSRHTAAWFTYPDPRTDPEGAVRRIRDAVATHGIDLLFPVTDDVILPLLRVREELESACAIALPPTPSLELAADKAYITSLAEDLGVPVPKTVVVDGGDSAGDPGIGWPLVVKPARSRTLERGGTVRVHEVSYARDLPELHRRLRAVSGPVLLQEFVRGEGHGVELLADGGRIVAAFQHRRIREHPRSGGPSTFREAVEVDPLLLGHSSRLLASLRWTGLAMVEFKVGVDGPRLMEINGRVWGSLPLAVRAGVDFPRLAAAVHLGGPPPEPVDAVIGTTSRNLELELKWVAASLLGHGAGPMDAPPPSKLESLRVLAGLLVPGRGYDLQTLSDPAPGVVDAARAAARLARLPRRAR